MRSWRSAVWNGALSLIIPGLGQVRARSWSLGVALLGVTAAVWVASRCVTWLRPEPAAVAVAAVLSLGYVLFALGSAVDAIRRTRRAINAARPGWLRSTWLAFLVMLTIYAIAEFLLPLGWRAFNIPAGSMAPTLLVGDYLIVGEMPAGATPARGDVVIFKYPRDNTTNYVKRVIGLSGDRVQIRLGQLSINGQLCTRRPKDDFRDDSSDVVMVRRMYQETLPNGVSYDILKELDDDAANNTPEYLVPPGHVFVLGDNRDNSQDSRFMNSVGYVPVTNVFAKAGTLYWSHHISRIGRRVE